MNTLQIVDFFKRKEIQFTSLLILILLLYFKTIHYDFNLDDYIITDTLAGKVNSFRDLFEIYETTL
jgi:hypothetical protein